MSHAWMPFYPSDYLKDTRRLTTIEHGAYLLLIMEYWEHRSLPDDDSQLAQITLMAEKEWRRIRPKIEGFFGEGWRHSRIDAELSRADEKSAARAHAGARGGASRAMNYGSKKEAIVGHPDDKMEAIAIGLPKQTDKQNSAIVQASSSHPPREEGSLTASCPKRVRTRVGYPDDFEVFWKAYPTDANMGKKEALTEWLRLSDDDKSRAITSCSSFRLYCETHKDYRPIHANRYLKNSRFEGHLGAATSAASTVFVRTGTPGWLAWDIHYRQTKHQAPPMNQQGTGWYFPSEYPPVGEEAA